MMWSWNSRTGYDARVLVPGRTLPALRWEMGQALNQSFWGIKLWVVEKEWEGGLLSLLYELLHACDSTPVTNVACLPAGCFIPAWEPGSCLVHLCLVLLFPDSSLYRGQAGYRIHVISWASASLQALSINHKVNPMWSRKDEIFSHWTNSRYAICILVTGDSPFSFLPLFPLMLGTSQGSMPARPSPYWTTSLTYLFIL